MPLRGLGEVLAFDGLNFRKALNELLETAVGYAYHRNLSV